MISIQEFEKRNAEAQRINAEIQKAHGALEENKRQFEKLCKQYEETYGEHVDGSNIDEVFNRVYAEVEKAAEAQRVALEAAKSGIIIETGTPQAVDNISKLEGVAPQAVGNVAQAVSNVAQVAANMAQPVGGVAQVAANMAQPAGNVAQAAPNAVTPKPVFGAPMQGGAAPMTSFNQAMGNAAPPQPISASAIPQTAFTAQADIKQPVEKDTAAPIKPAYNIPGWGTQGNTNIDFNQVLGGSFGG